MSKAKHNLWKRRKNKPDKLVRSHKQWLERSKHNKLQMAIARLEKEKDGNIL